MASSGRLTKRSLAVRLLRSKFEKCELTGDEQPKAVWESEESFQKHKLGNFKTCYNAMRSEFTGKQSTADAEDSHDGLALDRRCTGGEKSLSVRKRRASALFEEAIEDSDGEDTVVGAGVELISGELSFKPLYMISSWKERSTLTKRFSVAIILPSGVAAGDFTITVVYGGGFLQLTVRWLMPLVDVLLMHRWKLSDAEGGFMPYHPYVLGFEAALSELRKRSSDAVESTARIPLPFEVMTQVVAKSNLAFRDRVERKCFM